MSQVGILNDGTLSEAPGPEMLVEFDRWRHALSKAFVPLDVTPTGDSQAFRGALHTRMMGDLRLTVVKGDRALVRRTPRTIRQADPGVVKVALQVGGRSTLTQGARHADLRPGFLTVYRTSEQYELNLSDPFEMLVAVVPRGALRVTDRELADASARAVDTHDGVGALIKPLMRSLASMTSTSTLSQHLVHTALADLLSASIRASVPQDGSTTGASIVTSARMYIEANFHDSRLAPAEIAAHHNVSLRYLQKLFADDGQSIAEYIRQRRLDRCRRELADPSQMHRSINQICAANGIADAPHFSRVFKRYYGMSPREFRDAGCVA